MSPSRPSPRPRGRPPLTDSRRRDVRVGVSLTLREHAALARVARRERVPVSVVARTLLVAHLRECLART